MKTIIKQYLVENYTCIAEHIETLLNGKVEKELSEVEIVMNLTGKEKTIVWKEKEKLVYEFSDQDEIKFLIDYLLSCKKKFSVSLRIQKDEWNSKFNSHINDLLVIKNHEELREILNLLEMNK